MPKAKVFSREESDWQEHLTSVEKICLEGKIHIMHYLILITTFHNNSRFTVFWGNFRPCDGKCHAVIEEKDIPQQIVKMAENFLTTGNPPSEYKKIIDLSRFYK